MPKKHVFTSQAPKPIGPYSQGVISGGLLFISGQIPLDPKTNALVDGDIGAQTEQVLKNLMAVLKEAKIGADNVVKTTVYLTDLAGDFPAMNEVYGRAFAGSAPARATVGVAALPLGASVEIEAVAVIRPR